MTPGCVILASVQQSDGQFKRRPAVVLATVPPYNDLLICGISSKIRHEVVGFDEVIRQSHPEFPQSGLKVDSLIRLGLLVTIPSSAVIGQLGILTPKLHSTLLFRLADHLRPPLESPPANEITSQTQGEQGVPNA